MNPYKKPIFCAVAAIVCATALFMAIGSYLEWPSAYYLQSFPVIRGIVSVLGYGIFGAGLWVFASNLFTSSITRRSYESLAVATLGLAIAYQSIYALLIIAVILAWIEMRAHLGIEPKKTTEPNQSLQTTTMAVTDAAAQPPRQP
jgi:hypothetical protein